MINRILNKLKRDGLLSLFITMIKYPFEFKKRRNYKLMLRKDNISDRFSDIYKWNLWSSAESSSGDGSELSSTESLRNWLINNLPKLKVEKFVDASCGDFNWMRHVLKDLDLNYLGLDIVTSIIDKNSKLYTNDSIKFKVSDICKDKIPSCDLIMVRDCLFHLSFEDIEKFFKNLEGTDYKYLLTTTHLINQDFKNKDITSGDFRMIDLFSSPFNFNDNSLVDYVLDCKVNSNIKKKMILLKKKDVPTRLSTSG